jgi:glycine cleavage system H protein
MIPEELHYYKDHEWVRVEADGVAVIGITHFAQEELGDVVYVDLPEPGAEIQQFEKIGEIESVKAVNDLFTPVGGKIIETNARLKNEPELANNEPYGDGWMLRVTMRDAAEIENLMDASAYEGFLKDGG